MQKKQKIVIIVKDLLKSYVLKKLCSWEIKFVTKENLKINYKINYNLENLFNSNNNNNN